MKISTQFIPIILLINCLLQVNAQSITINATDYRQTIDMIGGDMERSAAAVQTTVQNTADVIQWGFGDINFNYCRVEYDKNQELVEGVKNWEFYDNARIITMQQVKAINPDIKFWATMRSDYDGYGDQNNMPDWIVNYTTREVDTDKYAIFLADFLEHMDDNGVTIHTLSTVKEWNAYVNATVSRDIVLKLQQECTERNVPMPYINDSASWSLAAGINFVNGVNTLGTKDLYQAFSSHNYAHTPERWSEIVSLANAMGKKVYHDETITGSGSLEGHTPPAYRYAQRCEIYEAGVSGEVMFEIWSRGLNNEIRSIYWQNGETATRLSGHYVAKHFVNNVLGSRYITSSTSGTSDVYTMAFRKDDQIILWAINNGSTDHTIDFNVENAQIQDMSKTWWNPNSSISGVTNNNHNFTNNSFTSSVASGSINSFKFTVVDDACTASSHTQYYRVNSTWGVGNNITLNEGDNLTFGPWPTRNIGWSWEGPNGFISQSRQVTITNMTSDKAGSYVATYVAASGCPSSITYNVNVIPTTRVVHITKRNATGFALDAPGANPSNGDNVYLWSANQNNANQRWVEIDRGNGYYSYQKEGTNFCIDGNNGGSNSQNVYLWTCGDNNQNQHWQKVSTTNGAFQLVKRNASNFVLDAGNGGSNGQNLYLWSNSGYQNQQWYITPIDTASKSLEDDVISSNSITIYPNPVNSTTTIQGAANAVISIYNTSGQELLSKEILSDNEVLDLSSLSIGIYYAQVKGEQNISVLKIIKE